VVSRGRGARGGPCLTRIRGVAGQMTDAVLPITHCKTGRKAGDKSGWFGKDFGKFFPAKDRLTDNGELLSEGSPVLKNAETQKRRGTENAGNNAGIWFFCGGENSLRMRMGLNSMGTSERYLPETAGLSTSVFWRTSDGHGQGCAKSVAQVLGRLPRGTRSRCQ
jgi:hypothetical protein